MVYCSALLFLLSHSLLVESSVLHQTKRGLLVAQDEEDALRQWTAYKEAHGKSYKNANEDKEHKAAFKKSVTRVFEHNRRATRGKETFEMGINRLADIVEDHNVPIFNENSFRVGRRTTTTTSTYEYLNRAKKKEAQRRDDRTAHPERVDLRQHGLITPVKDEWLAWNSSCLSSYAFVAAGAVAGQLAKASGELVELSAQNIIDCSQEFGNGACDGGNVGMSYEYMRYYGVDTEFVYPYTGKSDEECMFSNKSKVNVKGYVEIAEGDEDSIKLAVATIGPVSAAIDARHESFRLYRRGVYHEQKCSYMPDYLNHAVLIVGYGTNSIQGDYWIVQNDYGTDWGEKGYFRISRNKNNHCGIASVAAYPII